MQDTSTRTWSNHADYASRLFIFKVANFCNINCSYCYMYNMGDLSFEGRPPTMSKAVAEAALTRIHEYSLANKIDEITITLHGGEPLLVKRSWYSWFLGKAASIFGHNVKIAFALQTNGILLTDEWIDFLVEHNIGFGISVDGPADIHDKFRVDHKGRGTYAKTEVAIKRCASRPDIAEEWGILAVANPNYSSVRIFDHLRALGVKKFDFLLPDHHHDNPPPWNSGELSRFYIELFDHWYEQNDSSVRIRFFESIIKGMLGYPTGIDALGVHPISEIVVETDGSLEPLDVLRTCANGYTNQRLNVLTHTIDDLRDTEVFRLGLLNQDHLPRACMDCEAYEICGGGYLPHRFSRETQFNNRSIHCETLLDLFQHIHGVVSRDFDKAASL